MYYFFLEESEGESEDDRESEELDIPENFSSSVRLSFPTTTSLIFTHYPLD